MNELIIKKHLDLEIVTRNHSHFQNGTLKPEARAFKSMINYDLLKEFTQHKDFGINQNVKKLEFYFEFRIRPDVLFTKSGDISKISGDDDNLVKLAKDSICDYFKINDGQVMQSIYKKVEYSQLKKRTIYFELKIFWEETMAKKMTKKATKKVVKKATKKPVKTAKKVLASSKSASTGVRG